MNFYISDMHWGQEDTIAYDQRPFKNAAECYLFMREQWNQTVTPADHVYIIGDCLSAQVDNIGDYLEGLNGHLHLVIGNHDTHLVNHKDAYKYFDHMEQILEITDGEHIVVMCHYPMACWLHKNNEKCIHVFGHLHKNAAADVQYINRSGTACNAGCMINHYKPVTIQELLENNAVFLKNTQK